MLEHVYVVVWSMVSNGYHSMDTQLYECEDDCVKFFNEKYEYFVESIKKHDVPVWSFWKDMYKKHEQPPKDGSYVMLFDMMENSKTITYVYEGVEQVSYQIEYYCKPVAKQTNAEQTV